MEVEETEVIELDAHRYIQLETYRQWPNLGVMWSVRQRVGESDFPVHRGTEVGRPVAGQTADEVWTSLRDAALAAAQDAANETPAASTGDARPSFFRRLFRRD